MAETKLLYTCIPDPSHPGPGLRLTVMISPRLIGGLVLSDYPDMIDWPQRIRDLAVKVRIGGQPLEAWVAPARRHTERLDRSLWRTIFPTSCPVETWFFRDESDRTIRPFPAAAVIDRLLGVYRTVAAAGTELPRVLDVGDLDGCHGDPAAPLSDAVRHCAVPGYEPTAVDRLLLDLEAANAAIEFPQQQAQLSADARILFDALAFYKRGAMMVEPPIRTPELDFHARVALLGDHPTLLRRLGLVFDLLVEDVDVGSLGTSGTVKLLPTWRGLDYSDDLCPETLYDLTNGVFRAAGVPYAVADGFLRLDNDDFSIVQLDGDGALTACSSTMASVRRQLIDPHSEPEHAQALPALRSAGVTIVHRGRDAWLRWRWSRQLIMQMDPRNALLVAEDLVRGWRLDVEDEGVWRSLHRRHGTVHAADADHTLLVTIPAGDPAGDDDEEGYVKLASGTSATPRARELYLHESVCGWSGWSLSARRPGQAMKFVPRREDPVTGELIEPAHDEPVDDAHDPGTLPVFTEYRATPQTLPRLRFNRPYRIRARAVDLAGGSLPLGDDADAHASDEFEYHRFEPVPVPVLVQRTPISEAESAEHMVVRTEPGATPPHQVLRNERHVLAPKAALEMWEQHGLLDGLSGAASYNLARRECGTLLDAEIYTLADTPVPVADRELRNPPSALTPLGTWPANRGDPLGEGQYVLHTGPRVRLPWLADPGSVGLVVWDRRNPSMIAFRRFQPRTDVPAASAWHEPDSLMIILHAAAAGTAPGFRAGSQLDRELEIDLPPGDQLTLRYASMPSEIWLEKMAMWNLLTEADRTPELVEAIREGRHWMFTPWRALTLTHAAQRPVVGPHFTGPLTITRNHGEGRARIDGELSTHAHSTSHVDVRATWREVSDDDTEGATEPEVGTDAFRVAIGYHDVTTSTILTSEIPERRPTQVTGAQNIQLGVMPQIRRKSHTSYAMHELPDTRRRIVTYTPIGTTRWQEFFPVAVIASAGVTEQTLLQRVGEPSKPTSVPASAAPDAPVITQVLPTFQRVGAGPSRTRRGNGLRIYLERPWFSTGVGERLAILLPDPQSAVETTNPSVSRWGADPVWSLNAPARLSRDSFVIDPSDMVPAFGGLAARPRVEAVDRPGTWAGDAIMVVPEFSVERQQWYADVDFVGGAYFPFVALALARYQEHTVDPVLALSPAVRAEMVQVAPDRVASIVVSPNGRRINVTVRGMSAGNRFEAQGALPPASGDNLQGRPGGGHRMRARCEIPRTGPNNSGTELDWAVHKDVHDLTGRWVGDEIEWTGVIPAKLGVAWRVVIEESELYAGENHEADATPVGERITYVEILTPT